MIHPTALIDPQATLGSDVRVGPFSVIDANVTVGDHGVIGSHVTLMPYTTLGRGCQVHAGAVLGDIPQDTAFEPCVSYVKIGDDCIIREGVTIHRGTKPETTTSLGDGCMLMAYSHLAHNCNVGNRVIMANNAVLGGYVEVGEGVFISSSCGVHQFCKIGRLSMLGGLCGVSKDVLPFSMLDNCTMNAVCGNNVIGMRRAGLGPEVRREIKRAFKIILSSGLNLDDAVAQLQKQIPGPVADEFCAFIAASTRGICRPAA